MEDERELLKKNVKEGFVQGIDGIEQSRVMAELDSSLSDIHGIESAIYFYHSKKGWKNKRYDG